MDTKDYQIKGGPGKLCGKYHTNCGVVKSKNDTIDCEYEKLDRYHQGSCKFFDHISEMCRHFPE